MRLWLGLSFFASFLPILGCVSNEHAFSDKVMIEPIAGNEGGFQEATFGSEQGAEKLDKDNVVEWFSCTLSPSKPVFVLMGPDPEGFRRGEACQHPVAAEMLAQGFSVLAINRAGQGQSSGSDKLGDDAAIERDLQFLMKRKAQGADIQGLWGYGEASVEAFRLAKRFPFAYLIAGDAIYDWEKTLKDSQDADFKNKLQSLESASGEANFAEQRSIAWDFGGLPKRIYLYHNSKNAKIAAEQASSFKASLAAGEFKVDLLLVENEGTVIPGPFHRGIIQKILLRLKAGTAPPR